MLLADTTPGTPQREQRLAVGDENLLRSAQRSIGLQSLTSGFTPWIRELQQSTDSGPDPTLADLVTRDTSDWIAFARKNGVPDRVQGETDEERFTSYGREVAARIQLLHPTLFVQQRIASGAIPVESDLRKPIASF